MCMFAGQSLCFKLSGKSYCCMMIKTEYLILLTSLPQILLQNNKTNGFLMYTYNINVQRIYFHLQYYLWKVFEYFTHTIIECLTAII